MCVLGRDAHFLSNGITLKKVEQKAPAVYNEGYH